MCSKRFELMAGSEQIQLIRFFDRLRFFAEHIEEAFFAAV